MAKFEQLPKWEGRLVILLMGVGGLLLIIDLVRPILQATDRYLGNKPFHYPWVFPAVGFFLIVGGFLFVSLRRPR